jgi:molybdopterin converting factor small subunit
MMAIRVLFLGPAKDFAMVGSAALDLRSRATIGDAQRALAGRFPRLSEGLATMRIAVNQEFVADTVTLRAGDELAVVPPVSGG